MFNHQPQIEDTIIFAWIWVRKPASSKKIDYERGE
jgi:hypothetical protein